MEGVSEPMSFFELIARDTYQYNPPPRPKVKHPTTERGLGKRARRRIARLRELGLHPDLLSDD
jgi:hypothetical protein